MKAQNRWPDKQEDQLRTLYFSVPKPSASDMAKALNNARQEHGGTLVTRNAVIGKLNRIGLHEKLPPRKIKQTRWTGNRERHVI